MLNEKQIQKNAETLTKLIDKYISSDRKESIISVLQKYGEKYTLAPASRSKHDAYPGGLLDHTLRVTKRLLEVASVMAPEIDKESLLIVGLFHDFGKCSTVDGLDVYVVNPSEWHREKLGKMYEYNLDIRDGLTHAQRSARLLTNAGVKLTDDEYQAIIFHDGQYVGENISIKGKESKLLVLLHFADLWTAWYDEDKKEK